MLRPPSRLLALVVALLASAAAGMVVPRVVAATTPEDEAQRAAEAIAAARARANQAAEDYFQAEGRLDVLETKRQQLAFEVLDLEQIVAWLERVVTAVAVNRYVSSGAVGIPVLTDVREPTSQLHGNLLAEVVADSSATSIDDYEAALDALDEKRDELEAAEQEVHDYRTKLLELQAEAEAEVIELRQIEEARLHDEAVQQALRAMQLEQQRQLDEMQRRSAEAARVLEEERSAAAVGAAATVPPTLPPVTLPDDDGDPDTPPPTLPPVTVPPAVFDPSAIGDSDDSSGGALASVGASGGQVGGRTGGGGHGSDPRAAGVGFLDYIICPVVGGSPPYDSWLAPRDGGARLHQGMDLLAPAGTPLVAVVSGVVTQKTNRFGGITISLMGDNGNRYYYAHLAAWEGGNGWVPQGTVIGYVGDTGNATGIPHLHFQIFPGNGVAVNPYPSIVAAGC